MHKSALFLLKIPKTPKFQIPKFQNASRPTAAGSFNFKPPIAFGGWRLRPQTPLKLSH